MAIHWVNLSMASCGSLVLGGICRSVSPCETARISRLSLGLPGTIAGPASPPLSSPARVSSCSSPLALPAFWLWHL